MWRGPVGLGAIRTRMGVFSGVLIGRPMVAAALAFERGVALRGVQLDRLLDQIAQRVGGDVVDRGDLMCRIVAIAVSTFLGSPSRFARQKRCRSSSGRP